MLCRLGYADDERLIPTFSHLLAAQATDGGWRCKVLKFGAGPDTDASNSDVALAALDPLRFELPLINSQRLKGFNGATTMHLVRNRGAAEVMNYIEAVNAGAHA